MDMSTAADWYKAFTQKPQVALYMDDSNVSPEESSALETMPLAILPM